jgi:hypothetical protein
VKVAGQPPTSCGHKSVEAEPLNEDANHGNYVGGQHWRDRGDISVLKSCAIGTNFHTPSQSKRLLIKQFLTIIRLQDQLDSGSFLDHYAMPDGPPWKAKSGENLTELFGEGFKNRSEALKAAYAKRWVI